MDRDTHEYFYRLNQKSVVILRAEIQTIQVIIDSNPAWMKDDKIRRRTESMLRISREQLVEHQKDLETHRQAIKR